MSTERQASSAARNHDQGLPDNLSDQAAACDHEWRWLDAVHITLARDGSRHDYRNVECVRCGLRAWKHGKAPNTRPVIQFASPTTGRS